MSNSQDFMVAFSRAQLNFSQLYGLLLTDAELSLQQYALLNILQGLGPISMTDASKKLHLSKPAITNITDQLEEKKYLIRKQNPDDRRSYYLVLQSKGEKVIQAIQKEVFDLLLASHNQFDKPGKEAVRDFYIRLSELMEVELQKKSEDGSR